VRQQGFIGPGYTLPSPNVDIQRSLNLFLERHEVGGGKNNETFHLRSRPKLVKLGVAGSGPGRGGFTTSGASSTPRSFCVSGNKLYEITSAAQQASPTLMGTLNTSTGTVHMADNGVQLLVVDGTTGYVLTLATNVFLAISDPDFPRATMCAFLDQYILVIDGVSGRVYFSALSDASDWNGLDFATAEGYPDNTIGLVVDHRQVILAGTQTTEVWQNDGVSPFSRVEGAYMEEGIAAPHTLRKIDNSFFWIGKDENGQGIVYRANGYTPLRISTFALEYAIAGYGDISTSTAYTCVFAGHSFYCVNFTNAQTTWIYDIATGFWHEWDYTLANGAGHDRHRAEWHCVVGSKHIVGDYQNGNIYEMQDPYINKSTEYSDDGALITRERSAPHISKEGKRMFFPEIFLDMEMGIGATSGQGTDPQIVLQYSDDGGHTWSSEKWTSAGKQGDYRSRAIWRRMGSSRDRVFRVRFTEPVPLTLISGFGELSLGSS
jgi:hypothetical protein